MNGVHDMGGMHGMGDLEVDSNEPYFRDDWERRMFGIFIAMVGGGVCNFDEGRFAIERMGAANYLGTSYYEHWLSAARTLVLEKGIATAEDFDARMSELAGAEQ